MSRRAGKFTGPIALGRLVVWIMPAHRKDWARAMLNELAYIEPASAAMRWVVECAVCAVRERIIYQLGKAFMNVRIFRMALVVVVAAVGTVAGVYAVQKPYQQERIRIELHRWMEARRG
jgi:hypothetical protein